MRGNGPGASARSTPKPSRPGISTSRNTRLGRAARIARTASLPLRLSPTTVMSRCAASMRVRPWRAGGSSSTTRARISSIGPRGDRHRWDGDAIGQLESHTDPAGLARGDLEPRAGAVHSREPSADVGEADAGAAIGVEAGGEPDALIDDLELELAAGAARGDG